MDIIECLKKVARQEKTLFVCMGNPLRGDDGVGEYICRKLLSMKRCENIIIVGSYLENALGEIIERRPKNIIFIDAVYISGEEGTIIFSRFNERSYEGYPITTHSIPFPLLLKFIKNELKQVDFYILGVSAQHISLDSSMCKRVKIGGDSVVKILSEIIEC